MLPLAILLPSCATTGSGVTSDFCLIYEPIRWSRHDTAETVVQVKANNAKYLAVCRERSR
jgi:hypothetical protein